MYIILSAELWHMHLLHLKAKRCVQTELYRRWLPEIEGCLLSNDRMIYCCYCYTIAVAVSLPLVLIAAANNSFSQCLSSC